MKVLYVFRSLAHWGGIERVLVEKMNLLVAMYPLVAPAPSYFQI